MRSAIRVALQEIVSGGVLKRVEDDPRVEVVHASAQDVVVPPSSRCGSQEIVGGTHQVVPGWTTVAVVG